MTQLSYKNIDWLRSDELVKYAAALDFMETKVFDIINREQNSLIWQLEHEDVYTAGISAKDEDLLQKTDI